MFMLYGRARGTFNDPNVLGAFLVLPSLLVYPAHVDRTPPAVLGSGLLLLVMSGGVVAVIFARRLGPVRLCGAAC